jgi:hypothetical protein
MMQSQLTLYISAAPELKDEREALGRLVPSIPTTLGWQIVYTPHSDQAFDAEAVARADVHLLVLGADIKAPVGWEWEIARRAGRRPAMFRHDGLRTMAGDAFVRTLEPLVTWHPYRDTPDLVRQVATLLGEHLLTHAARYTISQAEVERLRAWQKEKPPAMEVAERQRATGASGVIFTPERYMPSEGTLVGSPPEPE